MIQFTIVVYYCQDTKRTLTLIIDNVLSQKLFSVDNSFLPHYHFTMNSFHNLKQYKKILLLFLLILCVSSLLAPLIKIAVDIVVPKGALMADLLNYKHGSYDFGKVMRRIILGVTILIIFLFRKPLMINSMKKCIYRPSWLRNTIRFFRVRV